MQKSKLKSKVDGPPLARVKKQHSFQKPVSKCTYQPICVCVCVCFKATFNDASSPCQGEL